ncbi:MAG: PEGA domain-containing protein [Gemmataceae bacterium]
MMTGRTLRIVTILGVFACTGCVERRFIIESNVPNAQVFIDDQPIGAAPAHSSFEYYGHYTVTLVHPGYETVSKRVHVRAPWYAYPPWGGTSLRKSSGPATSTTTDGISSRCTKRRKPAQTTC